MVRYEIEWSIIYDKWRTVITCPKTPRISNRHRSICSFGNAEIALMIHVEESEIGEPLRELDRLGLISIWRRGKYGIPEFKARGLTHTTSSNNNMMVWPQILRKSFTTPRANMRYVSMYSLLAGCCAGQVCVHPPNPAVPNGYIFMRNNLLREA